MGLQASAANPACADDATDNTHLGVWICRRWYAVPPQYTQNADGQLKKDQEFRTFEDKYFWDVHNECHSGGQTETHLCQGRLDVEACLL